MNTDKPNAGKAFKISVTTLAIMNITAVVSLRGLPSEAIYGLSSSSSDNNKVSPTFRKSILCTPLKLGPFKVAKTLDIEHHIIDYRDIFKEKVNLLTNSK